MGISGVIARMEKLKMNGAGNRYFSCKGTSMECAKEDITHFWTDVIIRGELG
jgi:hypothetical protein